MSHYEQPTAKEKREKRKRKKKTCKAVSKVMDTDPEKKVISFIKRRDRPSSGEIQEFIKDKFINEKWIDDEIDLDQVARKVFEKIRRKTKQKARQGDRVGKGVSNGKFIRKKTEIWYGYEKVNYDGGN